MVKIRREYSLNYAPETVWEALLDPEVLQRILPGVQSITPLEADRYQARIAIRIGPVTGTYNGEFEIFDKIPPHAYRFRMNGEGTKGTLRGEGRVNLEENGAATRLKLDTESHLSGILARIGQRLIEASGKKLIDAGMANLALALEERAAA